ncbi:MAG: carbohydrate-binding family 9-like protein [Treponema sp.]|nr:carbohydrate-binding family 9-like protein [Treponema sp.]
MFNLSSEDAQKVYHINWIDSIKQDWQKGVCNKVEINCFPWGHLVEIDYRPLTTACLSTDGESIFVYMQTNENELKMETKGFGHTHTDSCMEFFLSPESKSMEYLNWEFNPAGGMYLAIGSDRNNRVELPEENYRDLFFVKTAVHGSGWNLEYRIPLSFLRKFFPSLELKPKTIMRGNFYKCGDKTAHPHFGCWSPIFLPTPDFHCPKFFGELIL